jgi:hypothetical protein
MKRADTLVVGIGDTAPSSDPRQRSIDAGEPMSDQPARPFSHLDAPNAGLYRSVMGAFRGRGGRTGAGRLRRGTRQIQNPVSPNGKWVFTANTLTDTVTITTRQPTLSSRACPTMPAAVLAAARYALARSTLDKRAAQPARLAGRPGPGRVVTWLGVTVWPQDAQASCSTTAPPQSRCSTSRGGPAFPAR